MITEKTERGFGRGEFEDRNGEKCSIQKSSIATEDCIWLGITNIQPIIMASDAKRLGLNPIRDNGWVDYEVPEEVFISSRMHLRREDVAKLLPKLIKFVETGDI